MGLLAISAVILCLTGFRKKSPGPSTIVFCWPFNKVRCGDTLVIPYNLISTSRVNDTIRKYMGNDGSSVKKILIAEPSFVVDSIDFNLFPQLREITLSGNDDDVLKYKRYNFMDVPTLKTINVHYVFVEFPSGDTTYTYHGKSRFRNFIHQYRPDIRVKFPRNYGYKALWEENDPAY